MQRGKNVANANALQREAARATPAHSRLTYDAVPSLKSVNHTMFAASTLLYAVTSHFDPVILTFDLEHLQRIAVT